LASAASTPRYGTAAFVFAMPSCLVSARGAGAGAGAGSGCVVAG
jgi:hypothetical protein